MEYEKIVTTDNDKDRCKDHQYDKNWPLRFYRGSVRVDGSLWFANQIPQLYEDEPKSV